MQNARGAPVPESKREKRRAKREEIRRRNARRALPGLAFWGPALPTTVEPSIRPGARFIAEKSSRKDAARDNSKFEELCGHVGETAPRLLHAHYETALVHLAAPGWQRPLKEWTPPSREKDRERLFRSLANHLLAKYPSPPMLWSVFCHPDVTQLAPVAVCIGSGASLFQLVKSNTVGVPLTKKQCHRALHAHASQDFLDSIRAVQLADAGASRTLQVAWLGSHVGCRVHPRELEEFYRDFLRLCAQAPSFDPEMLDPVLDYLHRKRRDPGFSLKGRTFASLLRGMHEWHGRLHARDLSGLSGALFPHSGFRGGVYSQTLKKEGSPERHQTWAMKEVLTHGELATEGRKQRHCVLSYASLVKKAQCSIWSLTLDEGKGAKRALTIQLSNQAKAVVQMRGVSNRRAKPVEREIVNLWAHENGLTVASNA